MLKRLFLAALLCLPLLAQREPGYDRSVVKQTRIDLRDLGYPPIDVIPPDESAIGALAVAPDGTLYGATSGKRSYLFLLSPVHGYVVPLGFLKDVSAVHKSLVISKNGDVYIGTTPGGHLLRYKPAGRGGGQIHIDTAIEAEDLGAPAAGESIYALAIDRDRNMLYGVTYPEGQFFSYDIHDSRFRLHGKVAEGKIPGEKFENEKDIGRAIAIDAGGNGYTSGERGQLFRFSASSGSLEKLAIAVPSVPGREPYNRVDAWASANGVFYGGTSDGYLFRFDPKELRIENLGKPLNQYRIRGLVMSQNGKLYGVGGDDDEMARLFSYDPARGVYELLGMVDVNHRPYYTWQAYVIDSIAAGLDGTVYLGQSERKSKLYLYYPEQ
jgi:hypothetical protein